MTLISQIKSLFAPRLTVNHPALGPSIAVSRLPSGNYYWEAGEEIEFRGFSILVVFEAGEAGPSDAQVEMWRHIKDQFEQLLEAARATARPVWEKTNSELDFSDFEPRLIELPKEGNVTQHWELRLDHEDSGIGYLVSFKGDEPTGVETD
ncbi:hypothetical protein [Qipengyuania sp. DGS5-3]|uniref:hypothetical protein n=1 Tax=Qipengyuania sp. DGS5-3 TaxID=3349632 RepID=UPI0036D3B8CC